MTTALYYSPGSCALAPHIVLNDIGQPFELRKFATAERANYTEEYLAVNPKGRIPALEVDGFILTEVPAILAFLGRRFPDMGLYPVDDSRAEARCLELLAWSSNTAHIAFAQVFRPERYVLSEEYYPAVMASGHTNFKRCLGDIEATLQHHEYALGTQYSVVDPFWLVFYRWAMISDYDMNGMYPAYTAYAQRLCKRASVRKTLETEGINLLRRN